MSTEQEAERERIASVYDLRLAFKHDSMERSKTEYTLNEIFEFLDQFVEKTKIHQ